MLHLISTLLLYYAAGAGLTFLVCLVMFQKIGCYGSDLALYAIFALAWPLSIPGFLVYCLGDAVLSWKSRRPGTEIHTNPRTPENSN